MKKEKPANNSEAAAANLDEVKTDFITIASHQLRTPISAIRWSLDTLLSGKLGVLSDAQHTVVDQAYASNQFMVKVVNDLLRVSRFEEKGMKLYPEYVNVLTLIREVIRRNRSFARANNCEVILSAAARLPKAYIDQIQMSPVFNALIDNAIRYSRTKGRVIIGLRPVKEYLLVTIKDNGIGIPLREQHLAYTKFFRGHNAIRAQAGGLGLDLYIAKKILELSGGQISFKSRENVGTTFNVRLPLQKKQFEDGQVTTPAESGDFLKKEREFVAITVHELKAPLGIAKWGLEILQGQEIGKLNSDQLELIERIYRGNERLLVLVRDLLNLAKLQEGKFEIESEVLSLDKVVNDVLTGFVTEIKRKEIWLGWQKNQPRLPRVKGDPNRLAQVITNLISNAIKYTPAQGKIVINLAKVSGARLYQINKKLATSSLRHFDEKKGYLVFSVSDSGIGISPQDQRKMFTRFFRSQKVLNSETEGTGLGLYITKSIVDLHGGDIWFTSRLGRGSVFNFSLPII